MEATINPLDCHSSSLYCDDGRNCKLRGGRMGVWSTLHPWTEWAILYDVIQLIVCSENAQDVLSCRQPRSHSISSLLLQTAPLRVLGRRHVELEAISISPLSNLSVWKLLATCYNNSLLKMPCQLLCITQGLIIHKDNDPCFNHSRNPVWLSRWQAPP